MDIPAKYSIADGPEGLATLLNELLEKSKIDPMFAREDHYIMYQLGSQKSLIKVDTKQIPFQFVYSDSMGRPATTAVKDVIARFLWEKCGEKERYMQEMDDKH